MVKKTVFIKGESSLTKKAEEKAKVEVKEAKAKNLTWPETFKKAIQDGGTRKEIIGKLLKVREGATQAQAEAWTTEYLSLLTTMGYCTKGKDGIYSLILFPTEQLKAAK